MTKGTLEAKLGMLMSFLSKKRFYGGGNKIRTLLLNFYWEKYIRIQNREENYIY